MTQPSLAASSLAGEQRAVARQRILRAAGAALAARGLAATVDDVAEAAGISRRTIFRHFATRDALFVAVIRAGVSNGTMTAGYSLPCDLWTLMA